MRRTPAIPIRGVDGAAVCGFRRGRREGRKRREEEKSFALIVSGDSQSNCGIVKRPTIVVLFALIVGDCSQPEQTWAVVLDKIISGY